MNRDLIILSLGYPPNVGGLETHLSDLTSHFSIRGINVEVHTLQPITSPGRGPKFERSNSISIYRRRWFGRGWFFHLSRFPALAFLYTFPAMVMVALRAKLSRASVIYPQGLAAAAASRLIFPRRRRVIALHSDIAFSSQLASRLVRTILSSADSILCLSDRVCAEVVMLGIPPDRVHRFCYWVDVEHFKPTFLPTTSPEYFVPHTFTVLFVGRLIPEKGVRLALDAARELLADQITFLFAGTGPEERYIRSSQDAHSNVKYLGPVDADALPALYSSADVLLVPSPSEEGFGRVILEALACGTPVIATRRGGIPEVITPDVGILVEPLVEDIVAAIQFVKAHPTDLSRMSAAARALVLKHYSSSNASMIERVLLR